MNQNAVTMNSFTQNPNETESQRVSRETLSVIKDAGDHYARLGSELDLIFKRVQDDAQRSVVDIALIKALAQSIRRHGDNLFDACVEIENFVDANFESI